MMMDYKRFERQTALPNFGLIAQQKLANARVLVIGAGGLGCPALLYLAAAGIGTLGIVDFDVVSQSNLNRQMLFGMKELGKPKALTAAEKLKNLYPDIKTEAFQQKLDAKLCIDLFEKYDVILDASDNFATRYLVNDACVLFGKALVYGAVYQFEGQVGVFNFPATQGANYRDAYPNMPKAGEIPSCAEAGVLGILPGIIGIMQAGETLKLITGIGTTLQNKILVYRFLEPSFYTVIINRAELLQYDMPTTKEALLATDYEQLCGTISAQNL